MGSGGMTTPKPGIQVGSTRPLSRAERRAQAARVQPADSPPADAAAPAPPTPAAETGSQQSRDRVHLTPRRREGKRPFATQLRPSTVARLEWVRARGYVITDTVDAAINAYLDNAGVPHPDQISD